MIELIQLVGIPPSGRTHLPPHFLIRLTIAVVVFVAAVWILDRFLRRAPAGSPENRS